MPPPPVGVITATPEDIPVSSLLPGRIAPTRIAEVRARVNGIVEERVFEQGAVVKEGDVLFKIDPATYEVAVEAARAGVARAEAVVIEARNTENRQRSLTERSVTSQSQLEAAEALRMQAEADLAAANAELRSAEINLGYTDVTAPISGTIGRANVTEGALLQAGSAEVLTTIQDLSTVYADIQQPVSDLLRLRQALASGQLQELEPGVASARLVLDDGTELPHPGRLLFSEASVDPTSGQVTLRAEFPNEEGVLLPGLYVRVSIEQGIDEGALAVPSQAVQRGMNGQAMLYIVNQQGMADMRPVTLGQPVGNRVVVNEGLAPGDQVIVDGFQKIGPGAPVTPAPWTDPATTPAQGAPADGAAAAAPAPETAAPSAPGAAEAAPPAGEPAAAGQAPAPAAAEAPAAPGGAAEAAAPATPATGSDQQQPATAEAAPTGQ